MAAPTGAEATTLKETWTKAVDLTKQRAVNPTLYRALENSVAIAWEDDNFVVGIAIGGDGLMTRALNTPEYQAVIERAIRDVTKESNLRFRYIEGSDYSDWEYARKREELQQQQQVATSQKQIEQATTSNSWDAVHDNIARLWGNATNRSMASGRGRYIASALDMVLEAMERLYPREGQPTEAVERGLSRVVERIASATNSDPAMIAYLLFERWNRRGD
jgi:phage terminase Nu1 subunit (DNA packaging protein)